MLWQLVSILHYMSLEGRHSTAFWMVQSFRWILKVLISFVQMNWIGEWVGIQAACVGGGTWVTAETDKRSPELCLPMCRIASGQWLLSQRLCFLVVCIWLGSQQWNLRKSDMRHSWATTLKKQVSFLPSLSPFIRWMGRTQRILPWDIRWGKAIRQPERPCTGLLCEWKDNFCCIVTEMLVFLCSQSLG